jgi:hypothetical protein
MTSDQRQALIDQEEARFSRLRQRRLEAFEKAYRASLDSVSDLEEITGEVASIRRRLTLVESIKASSPALKIAALVTALGGAAGVGTLIKTVIEALTSVR